MQECIIRRRFDEASGFKILSRKDETKHKSVKKTHHPQGRGNFNINPPRINISIDAMKNTQAKRG